MSELPPANANEPGEAAEERHPAPSQPAASPPALARRWSEIRSDLPLVALLLLLPLLLNVLASRALAAFHAYPYAERPAVVAILLRSLRADGVALSALTLAILAARRLRVPEALRGAGVLATYLAFWCLNALYLVGAGVFMRFGGPLTRDLAALGPMLLGHSSKVLTFDDPLVQLLVASAILPALAVVASWSTGRRLVRDERHWSWPAWACAGGLLLAAVAAGALPTNPVRERRLAMVSPLTMILPRSFSTPERAPERGASERRVVESLLGEAQSDGARAFAPFPRHRRNVVIWVLESVGERFLRSHHPLGAALTPQLDRLETRGSVRFSDVHVECPLSVQSAFTFVTGTSPPANPKVYRTEIPIPHRTPYLPARLKAVGFHTAFLNSSYLGIWGERRFLNEAGIDIVEDADTLTNRSRYRYQQWSIEGRAILDRFFEWRDGLPAGEPFFAVIWDVETHFNYRWIGMPPEFAADDDLTRYNRAIEYTDRLLGTLSDGLVARGLEDTLIVAVGDHGQGLGRGERAYDRFESLLVGEDDLQVPLSFLHKDLPRGSAVIATPATLSDVYPTVLDLLGLDVPAGLDGRSLARPYRPRLTVSRAITWWPVAVRAGRFKLQQDFPDEPPVLYDVAADPWETHDVAGAHPDVFRALWSELGSETTRRSREDPSFALFASGQRVSR